MVTPQTPFFRLYFFAPLCSLVPLGVLFSAGGPAAPAARSPYAPPAEASEWGSRERVMRRGGPRVPLTRLYVASGGAPGGAGRPPAGLWGAAAGAAARAPFADRRSGSAPPYWLPLPEARGRACAKAASAS
jgi:hypothetical protein